MSAAEVQHKGHGAGIVQGRQWYNAIGTTVDDLSPLGFTERSVSCSTREVHVPSSALSVYPQIAKREDWRTGQPRASHPDWLPARALSAASSNRHCQLAHPAVRRLTYDIFTNPRHWINAMSTGPEGYGEQFIIVLRMCDDTLTSCPGGTLLPGQTYFGRSRVLFAIYHLSQA